MKKINAWMTTLGLAFIGGFLNSYSFYLYGGKFAFLQTGNMISLMHNVFFKETELIWLGLLSFFAFYCGVCFTYLLKYLFKKMNKQAYLNGVILGLDFLFLLPSLFFKQFSIDNGSWISIFGLGLIGGSLIEHFRCLLVSYSSTMMTNNTKLFFHELLDGISLKKKKSFHQAWIYFLVIVCFNLGIVVFMLFLKFGDAHMSILIPLGFLFILFILNIFSKEENQYSSDKEYMLQLLEEQRYDELKDILLKM